MVSRPAVVAAVPLMATLLLVGTDRLTDPADSISQNSSGLDGEPGQLRLLVDAAHRNSPPLERFIELAGERGFRVDGNTEAFDYSSLADAGVVLLANPVADVDNPLTDEPGILAFSETYALTRWAFAGGSLLILAEPDTDGDIEGFLRGFGLSLASPTTGDETRGRAERSRASLGDHPIVSGSEEMPPVDAVLTLGPPGLVPRTASVVPLIGSADAMLRWQLNGPGPQAGPFSAVAITYGSGRIVVTDRAEFLLQASGAEAQQLVDVNTALARNILAWLAGSGRSVPLILGPHTGKLVLAGGSIQDESILRRFLDLAGGPDSPIAVIATADPAYAGNPRSAYTGPLAEAGATNLTLLHADDRDDSNLESFLAPLRSASGAWFTGGRTWPLVERHVDTRVQEELEALLDRGGVVGGTSAGAMPWGSVVLRGCRGSSFVLMGCNEKGFAFLPSTVIDTHHLQRNRQLDLIGVIEERPDLLGIGIDADTAIAVEGGRFEVLGTGQVAIYDSRQAERGFPVYFLRNGEVFDLATRTAHRRYDGELWPLSLIRSAIRR